MTRLEEILSEHIEDGPGAWKKLYDDIEEYTVLCIKSSLKKASEVISDDKLEFIDYYDFSKGVHTVVNDDKQSITDENNIVLL